MTDHPALRAILGLEDATRTGASATSSLIARIAGVASGADRIRTGHLRHPAALPMSYGPMRSRESKPDSPLLLGDQPNRGVYGREGTILRRYATVQRIRTMCDTHK